MLKYEPISRNNFKTRYLLAGAFDPDEVHEDEIDHAQQDLETMVDDYLTRFDSQLSYQVEQVTDISDNDTTAAIEAICSAPCASVDDIASVITESKQIIEELGDPLGIL